MDQEVTAPDRRTVVRACVLVSLGLVAVPTIAACGNDDAAAPGSDAGAPASGSSAPGEGSAAALAKLSDVPVGGALVTRGADGKPVVLVQQTAGQVTGLSGVCTHQGGTVAVDGTTLRCPVHGSMFSFDGAVETGPATAPLPAVAVKVEGDEVVAG